MIKTKDKYEIISQMDKRYPIKLLCEVSQVQEVDTTKILTERRNILEVQSNIVKN